MGALVISLDFELFCGIRDHRTIDEYRLNLEGVELAVNQILKLFEKYEIAATWGTVGLLMCADKEEALNFVPSQKPSYKISNLSPYKYLNEQTLETRYHFAPQLVSKIVSTPNQELASHTFSHYYCLEDGQKTQDFQDDLKSATKVAKVKFNNELKSLIFPRNQFNKEYLKEISREGFISYRGNEDNFLNRPTKGSGIKTLQRALRLLDSYINITGSNSYNIQNQGHKLVDLKASRFLRPYSNKLKVIEFLKIRRIKKSMLKAAKKNEVFHLWWHPHNFGKNINENIHNLEEILKYYIWLKDKYAYESHSMYSLATSLKSEGTKL